MEVCSGETVVSSFVIWESFVVSGKTVCLSLFLMFLSLGSFCGLANGSSLC